MSDQMRVHLERDIVKNFKLLKKLINLFQEVNDSVRERDELVIELQILRGSVVVVDSVTFLKRLQDHDMGKAKAMMTMINKTQSNALEKIAFIMRMRHM
ncbi:hypothetical protein Tco_0925095 [Tanacetum coccineum]|uniref:Uncharacterized protein n=1 Tax=Tanacetum coccineum TaxID=301880 RepID=A0ABQ5D5V1_9ASTR